MGMAVINGLGWFALALVCLGFSAVLGVVTTHWFRGLRRIWREGDYGMAVFWAGVSLSVFGLVLILVLSMIVVSMPKG